MDDDGKREVWRAIELRAEAALRRRRRKTAAMKQITFYLDFISPYAYLAFEQLPQALRGPELQRRLPAGAVRRPAQAPRPARPGRDRAQARLDLPPGAVAGAQPRHSDADAGGASVQSAAACCGWRWPAVAQQPGRDWRIATSAKPSSAMSGAAAPTRPTPQRLAGLTAVAAAAARSRQRRSEGASSRPTPTKRSRAACSACPPTRWTTSCSGASTRCRCCAPTSRAMRGSRAVRGKQLDSCQQALHALAKG